MDVAVLADLGGIRGRVASCARAATVVRTACMLTPGHLVRKGRVASCVVSCAAGVAVG